YLDPGISDGVAGVAVTNLDIPITALGYTFQAPPEWGIRNSPGELQSLISQMLQAEADLAEEISNYGSWQGGIIRKMRLINAQYNMNTDIRGIMAGQIAADTLFNGTTVAFRAAARFQTVIADTFKDVGDTGATAIPTDTPVFGLADGLGDFLAPLRAVFKATTSFSKVGFQAEAAVDELAGDLSDFAKQIADMLFALGQTI